MLNRKLVRLVSLILAVMLMLPVGIVGAAGNSDEKKNSEPDSPTFTDVSVHDPSIVKDPKSGLYYVFGSHIAAAKSADLMNWTSFTNGYAPVNNTIFGDLSANLAPSFAWAGEDDADSRGGYAVWAPDVLWNKDYVNADGTKGAYLMYYSVSSTYIRSAIGLAVSKNIEGPYTYVDTLIYSGFTRDDAQDANSDVNKKWTNTHIDELFDEANPAWFKATGEYNNDAYPNAIDPTIFYDKDGNQWMVYGSWSGGLFIYEMDEKTGKPIYPGENGLTEDGRIIDKYFGTKIAGGFHQSGEGPYIVYDKTTDYYYLFETYGGLSSTGGYNMRTFRSDNPDGPYVDAAGKSPVFPDRNTSNVSYGNKLMSNYLFKRELGEPGTGTGIGYVSPGHNSVFYDSSGKLFNVFHSRFPNEGELHEVRVHQMFMNSEGWPVVAPYRYTGEKLNKINESNIVGEYKFIKHEQDNSATIRNSVFIRLNEDHSISGDVTGTWEKTGNNYAAITIDGVIYNGVFLKQWEPTSARQTITFTAMSSEGASIWGSKLPDRKDHQIVMDILNDPALNWGNVVSSFTLPTEGTRHALISWKSSNPSVITDTGVVTRPEVGEAPAAVVLTATVTKGGITRSKNIPVTVLPSRAAELQARYEFEGGLNDSEGNFAAGTVTGNRIDNTGGTITYSDGRYGQAAEFDGKSGVRLPNGLISGTSEYSVSLWLKPDELTNFTTTFFGGKDTDNWVSIMPLGPAGSTMAWFHSDAYYDAPSGMTIGAGEWSHVALTVEYGLVSFYVNGELRFSGSNFPNTFATVSDALFALGVNWWDTPYDGLIDDLRIYDGILSAEEVAELVVDPNALVERIQLGSETKGISVGNTVSPPTVGVYPVYAANRAIVWSSGDESIATCDPVTGVVTGVRAGTTTITATALDASGVTASYTLHVEDGPVAYYKFNGDLNNSTALFGAGTITGNRIDNTGGTITYAEGVNGQAAVLDGMSGIRLPNGLISTNQYTVSMSMYLEQATPFTTTFFGARNTDSWISFTPRGAVGEQTMLWSGTAWYDGLTGMQINTGEWVHVAFTVDNGNLKIYINGVEKHSGTTFPNVFTTDNGAFAFGVNYWDTPFKGKVDELRVYDKALTAEQVQGLVDITP